MPVIKGLDKYKTYITERVKGKDGITRPITKVKYIKQCPQCGGEMFVISHTKGGVHKPSKTKWWCESRICGHSEMEPTSIENIRLLNNDLLYGQCVHQENLASCQICNPELL